MGQFSFECCGKCGGNKEQYDWTPTVVVALPVGKDGADVHFRAEYNSYGNFFLRIVADGDEDKIHVGEYSSLGHIVRPCLTPELSTLVVTENSRGDGFFECSACYCFGAFARRKEEDDEEDEEDAEQEQEQEQEIGTRFCVPAYTRIFMGITLTELAKLHPEEAAKIRASPPDTDSNSFGGVGVEIELLGFTLDEVRNAAKGHCKKDGGLDHDDIKNILSVNGNNQKALLTNMCMFAPNEDKDKVRSIIEKRLQSLLNAMDRSNQQQHNETDEHEDHESTADPAMTRSKIQNAAGNAMARAMGIPIHHNDGTIEDYGINTQVGVGLQRRYQHGLSQGRLFEFHPVSSMGWSVQYKAENDEAGEILGETFLKPEEIHPLLTKMRLRGCCLHMYPHCAEECPPADEQGGDGECAVM